MTEPGDAQNGADADISSARSGQTRILALFPGALGDLLCCWPALQELQRRTGAALTLAAHSAWLSVLPDDACARLSIDRREFADLFADGTPHEETRTLLRGYDRIESWTGHGDERFADRLRSISGATVAVHPFRALRPGEHACNYFARCVGVTPRSERLGVRPAAARWADEWWARHGLGSDVLAIHPGSGSPRKNWQGMGTVATEWRRAGHAVIVLLGPSESARNAMALDDVVVRDEPLDRVAALLARSHRYLGNDSGISHLAAAVGARGVALFGSSDPLAWGPRGDTIRVLHAPSPCTVCGPDRFCRHRLDPDAVLAALRAA